MLKTLLVILGIGLLLFFVVIGVVISLLKKGASALFKTGYRRYSSSDHLFRGHHGHKGHHSYGHLHYRHRHSSHSFFSS